MGKSVKTDLPRRSAYLPFAFPCGYPLIRQSCKGLVFDSMIAYFLALVNPENAKNPAKNPPLIVEYQVYNNNFPCGDLLYRRQPKISAVFPLYFLSGGQSNLDIL
ncbi:MAG: hypothetical protein IKY46_02390 [Clostridia bacterium]|nr:hypothetical protein [Clostridia bacterium]